VISKCVLHHQLPGAAGQVLHDKVAFGGGDEPRFTPTTNDQVLTDVYHTDLRRARSATMSMIPTKTGAAGASAWYFRNSRADRRLRDPGADDQLSLVD